MGVMISYSSSMSMSMSSASLVGVEDELGDDDRELGVLSVVLTVICFPSTSLRLGIIVANILQCLLPPE